MNRRGFSGLLLTTVAGSLYVQHKFQYVLVALRQFLISPCSSALGRNKDLVWSARGRCGAIRGRHSEGSSGPVRGSTRSSLPTGDTLESKATNGCRRSCICLQSEGRRVCHHLSEGVPRRIQSRGTAASEIDFFLLIANLSSRAVKLQRGCQLRTSRLAAIRS